MKTQIFLLALAAASLAACDTSNDTAAAEANQAAANTAAPIVLPPSIVGSHKYRCAGNGIIAIDWLSDGKVNSARVTPESGGGINLDQAEAGGDYIADGAILKGDPKATEVTFNDKICKR